MSTAAHPTAGAGPADARTLVTSRVFDAPRERVWAAFADPALLARWWGPDGFRNTIQHFDFRAGGAWRLVMHGPDGTDYPNEFRFATVNEPKLIVMRHMPAPLFDLTLSFSDEAGQTRVGWRQCFDDAAVCASLAPMCVPANEQNLNRWQAVMNDMGSDGFSGMTNT
ncbi:SRPBCC family protein [Ottowia testudinis]|uniref:SRPBCC family protein n=1 Tax=Ottowia testudinis TaxID=2816950 RepID=A0A975CG67_9BURK|nr:SRPBCC family protein [Ottowia testudinis]QTD44501.1 SRPBCC family protein [Ottowia testudinis]